MSAEPMVRLADVREAFDAMCPACAKKVRDALIAALSGEARKPRNVTAWTSEDGGQRIRNFRGGPVVPQRF